MSCYQVLALNNTTGDLQITQGNTVNLVQAIKNFSVKTPVQDFKIVGNVLQLYYLDATGTLQLKTVTLPASGNTSTSISVTSTPSISATIQSGVITSNVNLSAAQGNILALNTDGLFVPTPNTVVSVQSSSSVTLTNVNNVVGASVIVSAASGNALSLTDQGLYVAPGDLTPSQIRNYFSAIAPIIYTNSTGTISIPQATASIPGYLASADWTTFNNKVSGGITVGSVSSTPVFAGEDVNGNLQIRSIATGAGLSIAQVNGDIILATTATVPVVSAGGSQSIATPTTSATLSATSTVANGTVLANQWIQLSGPNLATFSDTSITNPTVSGLIVGTYRFRMFAISSTGLTGSDVASVIVSNGTITLDTIYWGVQASPTPPNASQVQAGSNNQQNGANDVTVDFTTLTSSTPFYCWFAIPNNGGTYFKTKYYMDAINHGNIGGSTDLFTAYTQVTVGGIVYNVSITAYATQFTETTLLQA